MDDSADTKKTLPPAYPDPQAPITRRGILPSFCNPGRTVEIRDEDLVKHKCENWNRSYDYIDFCFVAWTMSTGYRV